MADSTAGGGPRRFLIAVAVDTSLGGPSWNAVSLVGAHAQIVSVFTGCFGYTHVETVGMNPTKDELLDALDEFCRDSDRRDEDILAVYFTGHGDRLDDTGEQVLVTADTRPERLHRALTMTALARTILSGTRVRRLLLLLDTCYSGQGASDFAEAALASFTRHWRDDDPGSAIVVISSTQPRRLARAGLFPHLLATAVAAPQTAGSRPDTIEIHALVTEMAKATPAGQQRIVSHNIKVTAPIPPFLPNPRHHRPDLELVLQQAQEWDTNARRRDEEFRTRFLVRARGSHDEQSWWFCGRHAALTDITEWLSHPDSTRPLMAVTGDPGSGKTAVLGMIAALTHPEYQYTVPRHSLGLPEQATPPPQSVDLVIYAQNLTTDQVHAGLATAVRTATDGTLAELLDTFHRRDRTMTVLIDGLDEASDPDQLTRELLRPLLEQAGTSIRLLVGTRPYLLTNLGMGREEALDLDAPRYADPTALIAYAERGLRESDPDSVYRNQPPSMIRAVAAAVAEQAGSSFLVARIAAATLAADPHLPDLTDPTWRAGLPSLPSEAMHHDLESRLRSGSGQARALLRPLAYAQGQGLPWEDLWAPIASRIAATTYTDHDLIWLRRTAGSYVVEATENGHSAYRLYHQALAEYLVRDQDPVAAHTAIVHVLRQRVPVGADGHWDWARAHPYILRYLATHAASAGLLDELITDMDYLVHAEPDHLLTALLQVRGETGLLIRAIYRWSAVHHRHLSPAARRQVLAIDAARFGATDQKQQLNRTLEWQVRWATGRHTHPAHRTTLTAPPLLTGAISSINAVACTEVDGRPIAITAGTTVRVWDLNTGTERAVLTGHTSGVSAVACTEIDGRPIAVTGSDDRTVRVWDLNTGTEHAVLTGHTSGVSAVACTQADGRPIAVTGSDDRTVRVWDLNTGTEHAVLTGHTSGVSAVACTQADGRPIAVSVSSVDRAVRVWDLNTSTQHVILTGHTSGVSAVTCAEIEGRPIAVTTGATVRVWDLNTGIEHAVLGHTDGVRSVACTQIDGRPIAVTGGDDGTVRGWDLISGTEHVVLPGHTFWVQAVACAELDSRPIAISASFDGSVRVWDLDSPRLAERSSGHTHQLRDFAIGSDSSALVTCGLDGTVRVWDLKTGTERAVLTDRGGVITAMACTDIDDRPVAVTGSHDGTVRVWDLKTGTEHAALAGTSASVSVVACTRIDGYPIAVTGSYDGAVQVWDLKTGTERAVLTGHSNTVMAVACTQIDGRPVAVTCGNDAVVRVWDLKTGTERTHYAGIGTTIACTQIDGHPIAAVNSDDDETILLHDLGDDTETMVFTGHTDAVQAIAFTRIDGRAVALTGSDDRTVRMWDLATLTIVDDPELGTWDNTIAVADQAIAVLNCPTVCQLIATTPSGEIVLGLDNDIAVLEHRPLSP